MKNKSSKSAFKIPRLTAPCVSNQYITEKPFWNMRVSTQAAKFKRKEVATYESSFKNIYSEI